jgi:P4 family phage/plasmid primase-like protien
MSIHKNTIHHYIWYAVKNNTEYDLATVLYQMYKESFVCVSIKDKIWYEFMNNRWIQVDDGTSLRGRISVEMYTEFQRYIETMKSKTAATAEELQKQNKSLATASKTSELLKTTSRKNNIMREAMEIFYDREFYNRLNTNLNLLGCNNCVIDIKAKEHRKGRHDDYISMTTGLDYRPIQHYRESKESEAVIAEIEKFMKELFPNENLREYMWDHLASTLMGSNENQTFNIYIGSGANGKSMLINLMAKVLGEYKGTVPITLITQKRNSIGSSSSEVYQLIGTRYAVMQEPSKGDVINEGVMKEITGGDPIQCRALFKNSVTFIPQFKLVVASNADIGMNGANDDGTWRRIRRVVFESKFTPMPYNDPEFPKEDYPYQFMKDSTLEQKFEGWAPIMLSLLVDRVYKTQGKVVDCLEVMESSNKYRQSQDIYLDFITTCLQVHTDPQPTKIKISVINDAFKNWYASNHGGHKTPPLRDLKEYLSKKFGSYPKDGWSKLSLAENVD